MTEGTNAPSTATCNADYIHESPDLESNHGGNAKASDDFSPNERTMRERERRRREAQARRDRDRGTSAGTAKRPTTRAGRASATSHRSTRGVPTPRRPAPLLVPSSGVCVCGYFLAAHSGSGDRPIPGVCPGFFERGL